jgi:predicted RNA-binding protein with PUA-like domain
VPSPDRPPQPHPCPDLPHTPQVVREAYPDHTQFDKASDYFDPKATKEKPRWHMVDIQLERRLARCARAS